MSLPPETAQYVRDYVTGLLDEIDRLRAELDEVRAHADAFLAVARIKEARLTAVLALCDGLDRADKTRKDILNEVRAAATGTA